MLTHSTIILLVVMNTEYLQLMTVCCQSEPQLTTHKRVTEPHLMNTTIANLHNVQPTSGLQHIHMDNTTILYI
jgi:hypothetical protein